jgi:hypothetical protein
MRDELRDVMRTAEVIHTSERLCVCARVRVRPLEVSVSQIAICMFDLFKRVGRPRFDSRQGQDFSLLHSF